MRALRFLRVAVALTLAGVLAPTLLDAQTRITVPATATGGFGEPNICYTALVPAFTFSGPQTIEIISGGEIHIRGAARVAFPNGLSLPAAITSTEIFPLEESLQDSASSPVGPARGYRRHVGALIGVFVSEASASGPGFQPVDEDLVRNGIASSGLFLVGSGPFRFIAPGPGNLYLGINGTDVCQNSGEFSVVISLVVKIALYPTGVFTPARTGAPEVIPVAILSSDTFDAKSVDPESLSLTSVRVKFVAAGEKFGCHARDVNDDGLADLSCGLRAIAFPPELGMATVVLQGRTSDGKLIRGEGFLPFFREQSSRSQSQR